MPKPRPVCARCGGPLVWKPRVIGARPGFQWQWLCVRRCEQKVEVVRG